MSADTAIEEFKKTFHINTDVSDVNFRKLNVEPYNSLEQNHQFGEKICLLYQIELIVFNIEIHLRILSFKYEDHVEVLKLEIKVLNDLLAREIAACKNFLQRKRVMNLTFEVLIKFAQLFEMRRLICQTVFRKQTNVTTITDDTGIIVKCCSDDRKVKYLELNWTISWNVEQYEVSDFIEFYFNYSVLKQDDADKIKQKLSILVEPTFDFHPKLKLWKLLMEDLYGCGPRRRTYRKINVKTIDVLEIFDSDSDDSVIEIETYRQESVGDEILVIE
ncbi:hypothetical protein MTP99_001780 [Tenebrio molitor]|nr:hypothetical protein MTP99_001780 [Tenebrio molitor]